MKTKRSLNGLDSGRLLLQQLFAHGLHSTLSKSMLLMVLPHLVGCPITGISGRFLNSSKMVQVGALRTLDIAMITII